MGDPQRIQLSRKAGWRLPAGAVVASRPSKWGNPFKPGEKVICPGRYGAAASPYDGGLPPGKYDPGNGHDYEIRPVHDRADAVALFASWIRCCPNWDLDLIRTELAGRDLGCWCPLPEPGQPDICHVAVILAVANGWRTWTPDVDLPGGRHHIAVRRCCNGCGAVLGDVTDDELNAAVGGQPIPDVRGECPRCSSVSAALFRTPETAVRWLRDTAAADLDASDHRTSAASVRSGSVMPRTLLLYLSDRISRGQLGPPELAKQMSAAAMMLGLPMPRETTDA